MPGMPPSTDTETDTLLCYLRQQRDGVRNASYGLTREQLRATPCRSELSVGGLIKHVTNTEGMWVETLQGRPPAGGESAYVDSFRLSPDDSAETLLAALDAQTARTEEAVHRLESLDFKVQLREAPWLPRDPEGFSGRWILVHLIEEIARHAGHADIIREELDGATMYPLMAAAEGWPETAWLKPWRPASAP